MVSAKKNKSIVDRLYDFFCSVKLSIFVLIALAITSIVGTVVQQGEDYAYYVERYGETWAEVFDLLNFGDMYHAWWFTMLLALLLVNITFCSIRRFPSAQRQMTDRDPVYDGRSVAIHERWNGKTKSMTKEQAAEAAEALLSKKMGKLHRAEKEGKIYFMASKGAWSRMGVYVTHLSLFLFAIGALVGLQWGFKGFVGIVEGRTESEIRLQSGDTMPLGFSVRCDKFAISFYEDGRPSDYLSWLTVTEDGKEVVSGQKIEVNYPLIHQGIYFYQSSYGQVGVRGATVNVAGPDGKMIASGQRIEFNRPLKLPDGTELAIRDMWKDPNPRSRTPPGVIFGIMDGGRMTQQGRVFEPGGGMTWWPVGSYRVRMDEADFVYYTGLQVAYDPGVPIVWAGCFLITFGLLASFFASHRRVWARVSEGEKGVEVQFAGNVSRNRLSFENWFEELTEEAEQTF